MLSWSVSVMKEKKVGFSKVAVEAQRERAVCAISPNCPISPQLSFFWLCLTLSETEWELVGTSPAQKGLISVLEGKRKIKNTKQNKQHPTVALSETWNSSLLMHFNNSRCRGSDVCFDLHINQQLSAAIGLCTRELHCNQIHARHQGQVPWAPSRCETGKNYQPGAGDLGGKKKVLTKLFFQNSGFNYLFFIQQMTVLQPLLKSLH